MLKNRLFLAVTTILVANGQYCSPTDKELEMKNVELDVNGKCSICHGSIDPKWSSGGLGSTCRNCFDKRDKLFGPDNVEIEVKRHLHYDPLLGVYEYTFDWAGTRVMINGQVGVVCHTYLGSCVIKFPNNGKEERWGTSVQNLDYWRLLEIYKSIGGEVDPPPLHFEPHTPVKAELLEEPILRVQVEMDADGNIRHIEVGNHSTVCGPMFAPTELPNLPTLHAFCNLYVRYKFGLAPNFCAEGGFMGSGFEIRNAGMFTGGVGLSVRMSAAGDDGRLVHTLDELRQLAIRENLIGLSLANEQARLRVFHVASAQQVLSAWINVMETLLRYDWSRVPFSTVGDVWQHYCLMQDVLLNIMSADELTAALDYAQKGKMKHCGCSY